MTTGVLSSSLTYNISHSIGNSFVVSGVVIVIIVVVIVDVVDVVVIVDVVDVVVFVVVVVVVVVDDDDDFIIYSQRNNWTLKSTKQKRNYKDTLSSETIKHTLYQDGS